MSKLHQAVGAAAVALFATATAAWAAEAPQAYSFNARAVANQVALDGIGHKHDPARFARMMALLRSPQMTVLNVERWAEARRGGGAGMGTAPDQTMPRMPFQPQAGQQPPVAAMPSFSITPAASVIGEDKAAREKFAQLLIENRAYVLDMRNRLLLSRSLRDAEVPIDDVIAVDVLPGSGNLEVFTVPRR